MQTRIAPSGRMTGIAGAVVLAGAFLAACGTAPADMQMTPEVRDAGAITARQVAVTVGVAGELGWEGRPVSRQELDELMRDAAAGAPRLLLVVVPVSGDVRYGDVMNVMQMAATRRIEARIADPKGSTE